MTKQECPTWQGEAKREEARGNHLQLNTTATPGPCQSAKHQCQKLLKWLKAYSSITTFEGREQLNIPHVAGRIQDLRRQNHEIRTEWTTEYSGGGSRHRIARYILQQEGER